MLIRVPSGTCSGISSGISPNILQDCLYIIFPCIAARNNPGCSVFCTKIRWHILQTFLQGFSYEFLHRVMQKYLQRFFQLSFKNFSSQSCGSFPKYSCEYCQLFITRVSHESQLIVSNSISRYKISSWLYSFWFWFIFPKIQPGPIDFSEITHRYKAWCRSKKCSISSHFWATDL